MIDYGVTLRKGVLGMVLALLVATSLPQAARAAHIAETAAETNTEIATEIAAQEQSVDDTLATDTLATDTLVADTLAADPAASSTTANLKPPLPFNNPQVGPVIRRGNQDDVELRTTAFIPTSAVMDRLTAYDLPEDEDRWIRIDLSEQLLLVYEGQRVARAFVVSTGRDQTPTITGEYRIRAKVRTQTMIGGSPALGTYYNLPNVEWVQYFYEDYGIHGTYWHNNFGEPMSHGCVNMTNADAKWLFDWAGPEWDDETIWFSSTADNPGTLVIVHE